MKPVGDDSPNGDAAADEGGSRSRKGSEYKNMKHGEIVKQFSRVSILDGSSSPLPGDKAGTQHPLQQIRLRHCFVLCLSLIRCEKCLQENRIVIVFCLAAREKNNFYLLCF